MARGVGAACVAHGVYVPSKPVGCCCSSSSDVVGEQRLFRTVVHALCFLLGARCHALGLLSLLIGRAAISPGCVPVATPRHPLTYSIASRPPVKNARRLRVPGSRRGGETSCETGSTQHRGTSAGCHGTRPGLCVATKTGCDRDYPRRECSGGCAGLAEPRVPNIYPCAKTPPCPGPTGCHADGIHDWSREEEEVGNWCNHAQILIAEQHGPLRGGEEEAVVQGIGKIGELERGPGGGWRMSLISILRRNWALRVSVVLNICVLLYVCAHFGSSGPWIEEPPTNWAAPLQSETFGAVDLVNGTQKGATSASAVPATKDAGGKGPRGGNTTSLARARLVTTRPTPNEAKGAASVDKNDHRHNLTAKNGTPNVRPTMSLKEAVPCKEKSLEPRRAQRGDYWVLYNYVPMSMAVRCWESVTYTTHADYTFLDNLEPLLERWRAPISIAMHAPGTDFPATLDAIKYSRNCGSPLIAQLVSFHVFFSSKHVPKVVPPSEKVMSDTYNCTLGPPWVNVTLSKMYKNEKKLLYPVNVGRNIARESAPTFYVFASDIELYPNPDLPAKFLEMIRRRDQPALYKPNPKVFVLSIFEVDEKSQPPNNKTHLGQMLKSGTAIPFHKKLCSGCHNVPRSKEWQEAPETKDLHIFHVGKRTGSFVHWEPIFIGTNNDPLYDERLSWEGKSDKMTQGYALCVLDYDFLILDNAFLVHRPGIKIFKKDPHREMLTAKTNALIKKIIVPELKILYGTRKGCAV